MECQEEFRLSLKAVITRIVSAALLLGGGVFALLHSVQNTEDPHDARYYNNIRAKQNAGVANSTEAADAKSKTEKTKVVPAEERLQHLSGLKVSEEERSPQDDQHHPV